MRFRNNTKLFQSNLSVLKIIFFLFRLEGNKRVTDSKDDFRQTKRIRIEENNILTKARRTLLSTSV